MNTSRRIQLSRAKGWRMPDNTVSVARPHRWANPYRVAVFGLNFSLDLYENTVRGFWSPGMFDGRRDDLIDIAYPLHTAFLKRHGIGNVRELRGKNLACFCKIGYPCHADFLLIEANKPL